MSDEDVDEERQALVEWRNEARDVQLSLDALLEDVPGTMDDRVEKAAEHFQDGLDEIAAAIQKFDELHGEDE